MTFEEWRTLLGRFLCPLVRRTTSPAGRQPAPGAGFGGDSPIGVFPRCDREHDCLAFNKGVDDAMGTSQPGGPFAL